LIALQSDARLSDRLCHLTIADVFTLRAGFGMPHGAETKTRHGSGVRLPVFTPRAGPPKTKTKIRPCHGNGRLVKQNGCVRRQRQSMRKYEASRG
jgi:hypothetical protein